MKKNYYELQVFVSPGNYSTIFAYHGTRSNCNRKFASHIRDCKDRLPSSLFRINTYSSIESMLRGDSPVRQSSFDY